MNRIARGADFRTVVRSGRRFATPVAVVYVRETDAASPTRFGFIVSKAVGGSVERHLVTRRLRAIGRAALPDRPRGADVVVRALPGIVEVPWDTLRAGVDRALDRARTEGTAQR
ncbi:ribonuclease P protein component [Galbitalea sp. SE-J8]|uniref:ribonuclease P protein component n=1 Tax=Galbitalea sp. SE-J8 TaxID=3054952 RepID=UPI00259CD361|nr:ribonuclease P protein component [Galbitalea sp. SE-J8]MDM4762349.1 ribonuclease P protein component [Galbitalea sp. SE-J8]